MIDKKNSSNLFNFFVSNFLKIKRVWRSIKMWGLHRTIAKTLNRVSINLPPIINIIPRRREILLVGCGQFGLTTASFFLSKKLGNRFLGCFDIDAEQAVKAKKNYGYLFATNSFEDLINLDGAGYLFIASNHASHTDQAIAGLNKGMKVHVEKPISVTWEQLAALSKAVEGKEDRIYVGYNRPFAQATKLLLKNLSTDESPFTIQYFIAGHAINPDHWYYDPREGTRICGNVGHWIDLTVHLLSQEELSDKWKINLLCSDDNLREENFSLSMTSERGDLITLTFSARGEPFDGVSENINIQKGETMAKIEDFRSLNIWNRDKFSKYRFWPKDVGHKDSVIQMFNKNQSYQRPWNEVFNSSMLMLHITDMVKNNLDSSEFSFSQAEKKISDILSDEVKN